MVFLGGGDDNGWWDWNQEQLQASVFLMPSCSGSGIYVVLMIEVSYVVMVAYPHWRVIIVVLALAL